MSGAILRAPAKLNFGLEIIGRRPDGFHEIVTILQAVSFEDVLTIRNAPDISVSCSDPTLTGEANLAFRALTAIRPSSAVVFMTSSSVPSLSEPSPLHPRPGAHLHIAKAIPAAAGLGGASSDAAAALVLANDQWQLGYSLATMERIAASLGSDVPFFLRGGTALATGRGTDLVSLPTPFDSWIVIVSPNIHMPRKTATLYRSLTGEHFSDGSAVRRQAERLRLGHSLDMNLLANAFVAPLLLLKPELAEIDQTMRRRGAPFVALSGAGPSHYTMLDSEGAARDLAHRLRHDFQQTAIVSIARPLAKTDEPPIGVG